MASTAVSSLRPLPANACRRIMCTDFRTLACDTALAWAAGGVHHRNRLPAHRATAVRRNTRGGHYFTLYTARIVVKCPNRHVGELTQAGPPRPNVKGAGILLGHCGFTEVQIGMPEVI